MSNMHTDNGNRNGNDGSGNGALITFLIDNSDYVAEHAKEIDRMVDIYLTCYRHLPNHGRIFIKFILFSDSFGVSTLPKPVREVPKCRLRNPGGRCNLCQAVERAV